MRKWSYVLMALALAVCAPASPRKAAPSTQASSQQTVVGLGDSVTAATACDCVGFITLYAEQLQSRSHIQTTTHNLGAIGQTTAGLLASLRADPNARSAVEHADIVVVTIGANDVWYDPACPKLSCYSSQLTSLASNLDAILSTIQALGHPATVLVTDYWDVWEDGAVGRARGAQFMTVGDELTRQVNAVIRSASARASARFVDLFTPFRGAAGDQDDTALLEPDGDHPSAAGHAVIARALLDASAF